MNHSQLQVIGWGIYLVFLGIFSLVIWAEWRIHGTPFMILGSTASILLFATLLLPFALGVSIFRGNGVNTKKWSYQFIDTFNDVRPHIASRVNVCDLVPLTGTALLYWTCVAVLLFAICFVIVLAFVVGFFFAKRPAIFKDELKNGASMIDYKKWPRMFGRRILPVTLIFIAFGTVIIWLTADRHPALLRSITPTPGDLFGSWIGIALIGIILVSALIAYGRTQHGRETRKAMHAIVRSRIDQVCLTQPVIKAEDTHQH